MLTPLRRGLLLVYGVMVFGDTFRSVDEVISPRFFIVPIPDYWTFANKTSINP